MVACSRLLSSSSRVEPSSCSEGVIMFDIFAHLCRLSFRAYRESIGCAQWILGRSRGSTFSLVARFSVPLDVSLIALFLLRGRDEQNMAKGSEFFDD